MSKLDEDLTSVQCPAQSRLPLIGSLDSDRDLLGCGASLDYQTGDWTPSQNQPTIDSRKIRPPEDSSHYKTRRYTDLETMLGSGYLVFIDTTNREFRWWDIMSADSWTMLAETLRKW